jgi:hypothetical protein
MPDNRKRFDCVEMMHEAQEANRENLEGKSIEEQLVYWKGASERLRARLDQDARAIPAQQRVKTESHRRAI